MIDKSVQTILKIYAKIELAVLIEFDNQDNFILLSCLMIHLLLPIQYFYNIIIISLRQQRV